MPWIAGQQLQGGKYVIEKVLGQGGFGITYKALQVELNRPVVIKIPNEFLSHDPEYEKYVERFIKEGRILARLSQEPHPHIVGVIDLFQEGNTHCLVMEFVEGENLFEAIKHRGALPESEIVRCISQIGEALVKVHQAGLVHRDAHPGNIMLRKNGKAVLIDFGIAKELLPQTLSSTGNIGNRGFAPYEQMTRGSREPTVDVYCLAATLYYAVTGQPPTNSLARKLENVPLKPPKQITPNISNQLNKAILKGMALEAQDRPQSMQAWLAILEAPKPTPPYSVVPVHKKEAVSPKPKIKLQASPRKAVTKSHSIIPWGCLIGILFSSLFIGYLFAMSNAPFWAWAVTVAGTLTWAVAVSGVVVGGAVAVAVVGAATVALVGAATVAGAGIWAWFWALAVAAFWGGAGEKLQNYFSQFHTFLILVTTSFFGLGLGLLVHRVFNVL
ncbi:serine/threonine protein kinase [Trichormus variabilis ATCC 29413]|uniref:Serine/threonine protein kinase n=2 Tax=Anabaena variabilis TaxID=264691 RepID=Q3M8T6_TRIV2|nr:MULTISPECIES: serine/threonine-protein kinase [Nostocaceae]ABA22600.1 serine/threonine protein kinase [Trichormus variabilis ATCC 29413]MBC1216411.1 serine/threonine protein kinase [Trichormus variabilis ARAD]MBC1256523.1 serine/threonine protein kinase [Trichormus variabilis V5]MBC1265465.1 serine/threonine protein kinase [Trichormus variabilis FSR]MBC1304685.1 serine/threonine protein kinase [Trichormus variabilis N2B]